VVEARQSPPRAVVVGGGLAGAEAAWQLVRCGASVDLLEARPAAYPPAHHGALLGELVCSNSLRSDADDTAPGLLKAELRAAGSLVLSAADATRVAAGSALAVDRHAFAWRLSAALLGEPALRVQRRAVDRLPEGPGIVATGPLTAGALAGDLEHLLGARLHFYDAIAPIVAGSSLDWSAVFLGARHDPEGRDYVNCPMSRERYDLLVQELRSAAQVTAHAFEEPRYFEGCLPIEVMVARGDDVLAHGPLRPVGLVDPRTGERPYAVVQLRAEDEARSCYNLVGFQTRLTQGEQRRVLRLIPGLERARFLRYGSIHRNTYVDSPQHLGPRLELRARPSLRLAGQITGVEGYLESTAMGALAGLFLAAELFGVSLPPPPRTTALGSLLAHVTRCRGTGERFEPSNITFGLLPGLAGRTPRDKRQRRLALRARALRDLEPWMVAVRELRGASAPRGPGVVSRSPANVEEP
jgi:methylenetetrahydrofolate--tRNA-(uracil-5-)-methyltransferase